MEVKREERINDNGSYTIKTVKTKTKEDGFVPESEMYSVGMNHRGKYHKGYMKVTSFQTNDPRITRPFAYGISGLFILIGLFLFVFFGGITKLMALMFIGMGVFALIKSKQDIDRIEAELKGNRSRDENLEQ